MLPSPSQIPHPLEKDTSRGRPKRGSLKHRVEGRDPSSLGQKMVLTKHSCLRDKTLPIMFGGTDKEVRKEVR